MVQCNSLIRLIVCCSLLLAENHVCVDQDDTCPTNASQMIQNNARLSQMTHINSEGHAYQEMRLQTLDPFLSRVTAVIHQGSEVHLQGKGNWVISEPGGCPSAFLNEMAEAMPGDSREVFRGSPGGLCTFVMRGSWDDVKKELLAHKWNATPLVESAKDWRLIPEIPETTIKEPHQPPNSEVASWGLDRIDQRSGELNGFYTPSPGFLQGVGVHCYMLDTGIRTTHTDFGGRAIPTLEVLSDQPRECAADDTSCALDKNGHGTHCAGTMGGSSYGVARNATIHAVKVIADSGSGSFTWFIEAVDWVVARGERPAILSASLGGGGRIQTVNDAINQAVAKGVTVIVAAGNEGTDACSFSPAGVAVGITVAATTVSDEEAAWSNYGGCVDIYAPGTGIISASHRSDNASVIKSGTSMATPHVAGVAALLLQYDGKMRPEEVTSFLTSTATKDLIPNIRSGSPNRLLFSNGLTDPDGKQNQTPLVATVAPTVPPLWTVTSGNCTITADGCAQSPNYPEDYASSEGCTLIASDRLGPVDADFQVEESYDSLTVNGQVYSGKEGPQGVTPTGTVTWNADESKNDKGWRLCPQHEANDTVSEDSRTNSQEAKPSFAERRHFKTGIVLALALESCGGYWNL